MQVLITGASGFIGRHVVAELSRRALKVRVVQRLHSNVSLAVKGVEVVSLSGQGGSSADWFDAVAGCDVIIHLAARAHGFRDTNSDPANELRFANVQFTRACAEAAASAGVKRFIFLSSVGVHGGSSGTQLINTLSNINPHTAYARSKAEAELVLKEIVKYSDMQLTILRPPLVYGCGAPGNFGMLVRAVVSGWPLPFGLVSENRRSFVAIDNLVDLIVTCLSHPAASNQIFLVSDGEDLSTADLICRLGVAINRPARLLPVPIELLALGARLLGKQEMYKSLCSSLEVDISKTCELLDWRPPVSVDEGLRRSVVQLYVGLS